MTSKLAGIGDDGRVHWWRWTMGEAMARVCDGVEATDVELYAHDRHGDAAQCFRCNAATVQETAP